MHKAGGLPLGPTLAQGHHGQVWNEDWTKDFSKVQKMREAWTKLAVSRNSLLTAHSWRLFPTRIATNCSNKFKIGKVFCLGSFSMETAASTLVIFLTLATNQLRPKLSYRKGAKHVLLISNSAYFYEKSYSIL